MNIIILNGSPRPNGNTAAMVEPFVAGAPYAQKLWKIFVVGSS